MLIKIFGKLHYLFEKPLHSWLDEVSHEPPMSTEDWVKKIAAGVTDREYRRQVQLENDEKLRVAKQRIALVEKLARREAEIVAMNKLTPCEVADRLEKIAAGSPQADFPGAQPSFSPRTIQDWLGHDGSCSMMVYTKELVQSMAPCTSGSVTGCGSCEQCRAGHDYTGLRKGNQDCLYRG